MKYTLVFTVIFILVSCAAGKKVEGLYEFSGKDFKYTLSLYKNKTFSLREGFWDGLSGCNGSWHYLTNDTILLQCGNEGATAILQGGYMSERNKKVIRLNLNQIKIENIVLIKQAVVR